MVDSAWHWQHSYLTHLWCLSMSNQHYYQIRMGLVYCLSFGWFLPWSLHHIMNPGVRATPPPAPYQSLPHQEKFQTLSKVIHLSNNQLLPLVRLQHQTFLKSPALLYPQILPGNFATLHPGQIQAYH